ncbi:MAG TPA: choice-of-anchor Q domain-containing protein [Solirubrobacterales bacterium]
MSVVGEGSQVPRIEFGNVGGLTVLPGANIARLDLSRTGLSVLLGLNGTGSALRLEAPAGIPVEVRGLLRDSFVHAIGATAPAVQAFESAKLRNVTALADGAESAAVRVLTTIAPPPTECNSSTVELRNVIARGGKYDLHAQGYVSCSSTIDVGFSNYRAGAVGLDAPATLLDQGGNQTGVDPLLGADRLHQLFGSATIDAGMITPESGPTDLDGEPRVQGTAPDIGADEFLVPEVAADTVVPVGSGLRFNPRRFRPRRTRAPSIASTSARKRSKRSPRSSRVSYLLTEAATVSFVVQRGAIGRRKGKRCVIGKRARRLLRARRCTRFVRVRGEFSHAGNQGANRFRFTGYIGGRRLRPGVHRMIGVPSDAAGNRGNRFRASFVIARR